ncbi:MAG: hypothetical protein ACREGD_02125 [Candidatus Saccharimonadales bacterium]
MNKQAKPQDKKTTATKLTRRRIVLPKPNENMIIKKGLYWK